MTPYTGPRPTMPMTYQPLPPPPRRARRRTAVVLGVTAVVLLLTAGVFTGLYVDASGQRDTAAATLAERRAELDGVAGQLADTEQTRDDGTRRNAELEDTRTELAACVDAVRALLWDDLDDAGQEAALDEMFALCQ